MSVLPRKRTFTLLVNPDTGERWIPRCPLLDWPSEPDPDLTYVMARIVTALSLMASGATQSWGSVRVTTSKRGSEAPTGDVELHALLREYAMARTHRRRIDLIREAQRALDHARTSHAADKSLMPKSPEWKARIAADPRSVRVLASAYGVSVGSIVNYRKQYSKAAV